ncbi:MAG: hypothetical protein ACK48R_08030, partial [Planctomyces sp.]
MDRFATLEAAEVRGKFLHRLIAVFGTVGYRTVNDGFQVAGDGGVALPQRDGVAEGNLVANLVTVLAIAGGLQAEQLVQGDSEGIN